MRFSFLILLICLWLPSLADDTTRVAFATRTTVVPKIDGVLEEVWFKSPLITDFVQYTPIYNVAPQHKSDVYILYDDHAIYIGAMLWDESPDSILRQLGIRDEDHLNGDFFGLGFDTYNNQQDAYYFLVYASGVQMDGREGDESYNSVWESKTSITDKGWIVEIKIPYSALRFPNTPVQTWGMQIHRSVRRNRETDYWSQQVKGAQNDLVYWGKLKGLENIIPPLRLSFTPYVSGGLEIAPDDEGKQSASYLYSGGLDLKYGINESFTLDLTLLPDFSQVQSDNKVKNLSAFETVYDEQRPFFFEATDLFLKGDLFYSRRIGRQPENFYGAEYMADSTERLVKNPTTAQLINAAKISGRTNSGLGIGVFNAITGNTYAVLENNAGEERNVLTEPFANYNIIVFDQALKNNSSVYLINTNFFRNKDYYNSNATATGLRLVDKTNTWLLSVTGATTSFYSRDNNSSQMNLPGTGWKYSVTAGKGSGKFQFKVTNSFMDEKYDANDVGLTLYNNYMNYSGNVSYHIYEPFSIFRDMSNSLNVHNSNHYLPMDFSSLNLNYQFYTTFVNYLSVWASAEAEVIEGHDYYEPRIPGRFFTSPKYYGFHAGYSSDYRKTLALDGSAAAFFGPSYNSTYTELEIEPIIRASDHLQMRYQFQIEDHRNDIGFATFNASGDSSVFGLRNIITVTNTFYGRYIFVNDLALSLRFRHYWSQGTYSDYFVLQEDGSLSESVLDEGYSEDFNFNAFTIDLGFSWQFAPGSILSVVWKNEILSDNNQIIHGYFRNLDKTFGEPQMNLITIKLLYYLDYMYLTKKK